MIIKTTEKIGKGEITFPTIGYSVKANFQVSISESKYYNQDIQDGLARGFLEVVLQDNEEVTNRPQTDAWQLTNVGSSPLSIEDISLQPGASTTVRRELLETTNFKYAISEGFLEVKDLSIITDGKDPKKTTKGRKTKTKPRSTIKKKEEVEEETDSPEEAIQVDPNEGSPKTNMQAWDGHKQKSLNKKDATDTFAEQQNMTIKKADKDPKWVDGMAPDDEQEVKTEPKKGRRSYKVSKKKKSKGSGKRIEPTGEERPKPIDPDVKVEFINVPRPANDLVEFVDKTQEAERAKSHPKLADQNSEVELE